MGQNQYEAFNSFINRFIKHKTNGLRLFQILSSNLSDKRKIKIIDYLWRHYQNYEKLKQPDNYNPNELDRPKKKVKT